jgi:hypothetical protein
MPLLYDTFDVIQFTSVTELTTYGMTVLLLQATNIVNMNLAVSLIYESPLTEEYMKTRVSHILRNELFERCIFSVWGDV